MKEYIQVITVVIILGFIFFLAGKLGEQAKLDEIKERALKMKNKPCYTEADLELIIFNDPQL